MLEELYIGDLKEDGDRQAVREANKMHRHSLLTHSGMQRASTTSRLGLWTRRFIGVAIAFAVWAVVAASSNWEYIGFVRQQLQG